MKTQTHKLIIEKAIMDLNLMDIQKEYLIKGVLTADDKKTKLLSHFYSPYKRNWLGNAKKQGLKHFNQAVKLYKEGSPKQAFLKLGYACHLLADLAVPAHSQLIYHYFDSDDMENYIEDNLDKMELVDFKVDKRPDTEDYFKTMARISSKFPCKKNNILISIKYKLHNGRYTLLMKELKRQAEFLLPLAIKFTNNLLKEFMEEIK